ncbi:MAG: lysylphosphatidylglycerol synthase transmembrane domain-containing protein [Vicinamibacterales bacterium]
MTPAPETSNGGRSPAAVFLARLLRVAVAAALLWWALHGAAWDDLAGAVRRADWRWLAAAVALVVVDRALNAWRWLVLLRAIEPAAGLSLWPILRIFFISTFAGTFLPGSVGGDAVRAVSLTRLRVPLADAVASVAVDRLLGTVSVVLMALAGLLLAGRMVDDRLVLAALVAAVAAALGTGLLLFDSRVLARGVDLFAGRFTTLHRLAHKFLSAVRQYGTHREALAVVLGGSVAVQVLRTLQAWCLGLSLGLAPGGIWYFAWVPLIVLVMLLPISISGLGTGNAAFVALFGLAGVARADAVVLSLLFLGLGAIGNLPGGLLLAVEPRRTPAPPSPSS